MPVARWMTRCVVCLSLAVEAGCAESAGADVAEGRDAGGNDSDVGDAGAGGSLNLPTSDADADADCEAQTLSSTLEKKPLDIVIYFDSSSSMGSARTAIQQSFDQYFSQALEKSQIDYRVITIAASPLVTAPANPTRYFFYPRGTGSKEIPAGFLNTFDTPPAPGKEPALGWSQWARTDASKALIAITDSGSGPTLSPAAFETQLYTQKKFPGFGTATNRNYRFHFVSGFVANTPVSTPWPPTDPVVKTAKCAGVGALGQELAILSGGLRFSMCEYAHYGEFFSALAVSEVDLVPVKCSFAVPSSETGQAIDPDTIELEFQASGKPNKVQQVHSLSECESGGFYVSANTIELCPSTCEVVQSSVDNELTIRHGCPTGFVH